MDVFLQEHGKTVFIAVCILLLVGVAYAIGPVISKAVQDVVGSYTTSVTFDSIAGKIPTAGAQGEWDARNIGLYRG